jgi:putative transposase
MLNLPKHRRRSIRLKNYDYSNPGYYFVTVCTENRKCLFGEIHDGKIELNPLGKMIQTIWMELPKHFPTVGLDTFVVMPNHLHGIIALNVGAGSHARPGFGQARRPAPTLSLSDVIQRFKSYSTHCYLKAPSDNKKPSPAKLWQRNYYEHVIRRDESLEKIRGYIQENPLKWDLDEENPRNIKSPKK